MFTERVFTVSGGPRRGRAENLDGKWEFCLKCGNQWKLFPFHLKTEQISLLMEDRPMLIYLAKFPHTHPNFLEKNDIFDVWLLEIRSHFNVLLL